jgi:endo-1,4-beta-xylanase
VILKFILCAAMAITCCYGCKKNAIQTCNDDIGIYKFAKFPIGTAVNWNAFLLDNTYKNILTKQFNRVTAENIFKPIFLHPSENIFEFANADSLTNFCVANNKQLHGHTLLWHQQLPQWMIDFNGNAAQWDNMMKQHITTIVHHFKNKVIAWDVVNEAFNEDGTLRNNIWKQHIGPSYIEKAYRYAKEADANAILFYNDYNLESNNNKRNAVLNLLNTLRNRGVVIHGIGLQIHVNTGNKDLSEVANTFQLFSSNGYKVHLSEVDISINPLGQQTINIETGLQQQAQFMGGVLKAYKQLPEAHQYGITFWGISDNYSWIRSYYNRIDYPLLYNENYEPKPIYCTLKKNL